MASFSRSPVRKALVIPGCLLVPATTQDVPSQRDGLILVIGRELEPGEPLPPEGRRVTEYVPFVGIEVQPGERVPENQLITEKVDGKVRCYRPVMEGDSLKSERLRVGKVVKHYYRWREGDHVKKGQLLALVDPSLVTEDFAIRCTRLVSMEAERQTGLAMLAEAEQRLRTAKQLYSRGAFSLEELRTAQLTLDRYRFEEVSKRQAVALAQRELSQARTVLAMYEIRSKIDGVILAIARKPGEAVKSLEPVFRLQDSRRLYVEGQAEWQHWPLLQGMKTQGRRLVVEPTQPIPPQQQFSGHLLEVTGVAVTKDVNRPLIVSGSEDGTVRIWDKRTGRERAILRHPAPVCAVACTPPGAEDNLCLAGTADGSAWLWDLDGTTPGEPRALRERHRGPVNSVSFSPGGKRCATGGEDGTICLWESATGELRCRLTNAHRGRVTSVQFTSDARLVSAGADNCLLVWAIGTEDVCREAIRYERRNGNVAQPGVSTNGQRVLLDIGKELRIVSLAAGTTEGILQNPGKSGHFTTLALFSPDGRMALTVRDPGGLPQLWRAPTDSTRPYEVQQLIWPKSAATCGAFAPNGSFLVTGMKDRQVLVWPVPSLGELTRRLEAEITLVEPSLDPKSRRLRIRAEMDNPRDSLIPGATATLVCYPP